MAVGSITRNGTLYRDRRGGGRDAAEKFGCEEAEGEVNGGDDRGTEMYMWGLGGLPDGDSRRLEENEVRRPGKGRMNRGR